LKLVKLKASVLEIKEIDKAIMGSTINIGIFIRFNTPRNKEIV